MKSQFQDIVPPEKRSIRNIPIETHEEHKHDEDIVVKKTKKIHEDKIEEVQTDELEAVPSEVSFSSDSHRERLVYTGNKKVQGSSKLFLWLITLGAVIALFFVVTYFLHTAHIGVSIKKYTIDVPKQISLSLTPSPEEVGYSVVNMTDSMTANVLATEEKEVAEKAQGNIIIYNNYDTNSQRFTEGTRFETPKGLIFKITAPVVVPGKKKVNGKDVPGSIEVLVVAEKAGAEYNIEPSDFTIPGLKTDPRFSAFYARSKAAFSGGNIGKVAVVEEEEKQKITDSLKPKIQARLEEKILKEIPEKQVLVKSLTSIAFEALPPKLQDGKAVIEVKATLKAYVFDSYSFAKALLLTKDVKVHPEDTFLINTELISAVIENSGAGANTFIFGGTADVSYVFNKEVFKNEILGIKAGSLREAALKHNAISEINFSISPFWKKTIPNNPKKINIEAI